MNELEKNCQKGDLITIAGLYADGSQERNDTPREHYANKPEQFWRCDTPTQGAMNIQPVHADGTPDPDYYRRRAVWMRNTPHWPKSEPSRDGAAE